MKPSALALAFALLLFGFYAGFRTGHSTSDVPEAVYGAEAEERFATILRIPEANARAIALASFLERANPNDAAGLNAVLHRERRHSDEVAEALFASWWGRFDPESALRERSQDPFEGRHPWIRSVVSEWTRKSPKDALAAVTAMPQQPWEPRQVAARALARAWFEVEGSDPHELLDLLEGLGERGEIVRARGEAVDDLLLAMIDARGFEAAEKFVESVPDRGPGFRMELFGRLVGDLTLHDPRRAYAFAQRHLDTPHGRNTLLYLGATWGYKNGPEAMEWALALPPGHKTEKVVERAWRSFALRDREAARAWMSQQQPAPSLEAAYTVYLLGTANEDPREAIRLAPGVQDPDRRKRVLVAAGRAWLAKEPEAAEAWIASGEVAPEIAESIRNPFPRLGQKRPARPGRAAKPAQPDAAVR